MLLALFAGLDLLLALLKQVERLAALLGQVRHGFELLLPELGDGDGLLLLVGAVGRHPLLRGMGQDALEILRLERVEDIEEVLARRAPPGRVLVREVAGELWVLAHVGPKGLHGQLVIMRNSDLLDVGLLHELLFAAQNVLEEVLVHDVLIRQIVQNPKTPKM